MTLGRFTAGGGLNKNIFQVENLDHLVSVFLDDISKFPCGLIFLQ
jgi:hypothetical protein